jgi:predicted sugar kinase
MRSLFAGPKSHCGIALLSLLLHSVSFGKIEQMTNVKKSTANNIFRHAETNAMDKWIKEAIDWASAANRRAGPQGKWGPTIWARPERAHGLSDRFRATLSRSG